MGLLDAAARYVGWAVGLLDAAARYVGWAVGLSGPPRDMSGPRPDGGGSGGDPRPKIDWILPKSMPFGMGGPAEVTGRNFEPTVPTSEFRWSRGDLDSALGRAAGLAPGAGDHSGQPAGRDLHAGRQEPRRLCRCPGGCLHHHGTQGWLRLFFRLSRRRLALRCRYSSSLSSVAGCSCARAAAPSSPSLPYPSARSPHLASPRHPSIAVRIFSPRCRAAH